MRNVFVVYVDLYSLDQKVLCEFTNSVAIRFFLYLETAFPKKDRKVTNRQITRIALSKKF